jgi:hypothetical protein
MEILVHIITRKLNSGNKYPSIEISDSFRQST